MNKVLACMICLFAALAMSGAVSANETSLNLAQSSALEIEFWRSIKNSSNADEVEAFLEKFPNGTFAKLAKIKLDRLRSRPPASRKTKKSGQTSKRQIRNLVSSNKGIVPGLPPLTKERCRVYADRLKAEGVYYGSCE